MAGFLILVIIVVWLLLLAVEDMQKVSTALPAPLTRAQEKLWWFLVILLIIELIYLWRMI